MASEKTGAIIVLEKENNLDFLTSTGDEANIEAEKDNQSKESLSF